MTSNFGSFHFFAAARASLLGFPCILFFIISPPIFCCAHHTIMYQISGKRCISPDINVNSKCRRTSIVGFQHEEDTSAIATYTPHYGNHHLKSSCNRNIPLQLRCWDMIGKHDHRGFLPSPILLPREQQQIGSYDKEENNVKCPAQSINCDHAQSRSRAHLSVSSGVVMKAELAHGAERHNQN
jgi:hypothetical protein